MAKPFGPEISISGTLPPWYGKPMLPAGKEIIFSYKSPEFLFEMISGDGIEANAGVAVTMVGVEEISRVSWKFGVGFTV